jgi:hypothetical protein
MQRIRAGVLVGLSAVECGGLAGLERNPLIEEWVQGAIMLYLHQDQETPLSILPYSFKPDHPAFNRLLDHCQQAETLRRFRDVAKGTIRRGVYVPAERLISSVCGSPAFQVRCGTSFKLEPFLQKDGILLVEGGSLRNVSFDAMRTMLGAVILRVVQFVRSRSRPLPRVRLVIDEASTACLISAFECRALAELQKSGLDCDLLLQSLNLDSAFLTDGVLQNTQRHEWFFCGNAAVAQAGAADLGDPSYKQQLMQLSRGVRFVKEHGRVHREYVEPLEAEPWHFPGLSKIKAERALRQIQKRTEYQTPSLELLQAPPGEPSTKQSSADSPSTPALSGSSPTSTAASRMRAGQYRQTRWVIMQALEESIDRLAERVANMESTLARLVEQRAVKDWYSTAEVATLLAKAEFTVREWCRLGRVHAAKRLCGRGCSQEWIISHDELTRIRNEGLLPLTRGY